jgi:hypothetical protein
MAGKQSRRLALSCLHGAEWVRIRVSVHAEK